MAKARKAYVWKDPGGLTLAVTILMVVNVAIHLGSLAVCLVYGGRANYSGSDAEFTGPQFARWAADALLLVFYLPAIAVIFWILRVSRNAHVFKPNLKNSPFGAVAWYIVPFASLVKPFEAMSEIWSASASPGESDRGRLLNWWWGLFLLSSFFAGVASQIPDEVSIWLRFVGDASSIAVSVILILMAQRLCRMQRVKHQAWDVFGPAEISEPNVLERVST